MSIHKIATGNVITVKTKTPIAEAAKLMQQHNIGQIVVTENGANDKPIGVLTDRDIATKIVASEVDPKSLCVIDVMSRDLLVLKSQQGIQQALDMMSAKGIRRAPIIDDNNKIVGIISIDDLLILIADELNSLAKLVRKQITS